MIAPSLLDGKLWSKTRIGILGGTFDPPHEGHKHIAQIALSALCLDAVWWIPALQNPLKLKAGLSFDKRAGLCAKVIGRHPKMLVSNAEKKLKTQSTFDLIVELKKRFPDSEFVWIGGFDSAINLHKWHKWQEILQTICTIYIARPPAIDIVKRPLTRSLSGQKHAFLNNKNCGKRPLSPNLTYWAFEHGTHDASSTLLRGV